MLPRPEYIASLPRKVVGAGVVLRNAKGEILIVKPTYRDGWLIPGGTVEPFESPMKGVIREVKEEIGIDIEKLTLCSLHYIDYTHDKLPYDGVTFIFDAGTLTDEQISQVTLPETELSEWRFALEEEALSLLSPALSYRVSEGVKAFRRGEVALLDKLVG